MIFQAHFPSLSQICFQQNSEIDEISSCVNSSKPLEKGRPKIDFECFSHFIKDVAVRLEKGRRCKD